MLFVQEKYISAFRAYGRAITDDPTHLLAQFGYGQLCIWKGIVSVLCSVCLFSLSFAMDFLMCCVL